MATVVALVPDLLFGSKVIEMLKAAGHEVVLCAQEDDFWGQADRAEVAVLDLASDDVDGIMLVDSMRSAGELKGIRTLGFYSHVDDATRRRAQAAGFDLVVPRSRMAREGGELVTRLADQAA